LVSSVLVSLYAVATVLSQIWGPPFFPGPPGRGVRGALPPALHTLHGSNGILPEGVMQNYVKWPNKEVKHYNRYLKVLQPISLPPFVDWPIPDIDYF